MKKLLTYLIIVTSLFMTPLSHSAESDILCGMEDTPEGMKVKTRSGEICEEDVFFQSLYIMFADTLNDPASRFLVTLFVDEEVLDSDFTKFADSTIGVSGPIHFILSGVAILVWALLTPLLAVLGYKYAVMIKKTGSVDFEGGKGDSVMFISFTSFLLILIMPTGFSSGQAGDKPPLMIGQTLAIVGALPATMGGNYFFSTYLSATEMGSNDVPIKENMLLPTGQNISNGLIETSLCQISTRQALMNLKAKAGSAFFTNRTLGERFDYDQESVAWRYDVCLSYVGDVASGPLDRTISTLSMNKYTKSTQPKCTGYLRFYDNDAYGDEHSCGTMSYNFGEDKFPNLEELVDGENDNVSSLANRFNAPYYYDLYRHQIRTRLKLVLNDDTMTAVEKYAKIERIAIDEGSKVFAAGLNGSTILKEGSNDEKQTRHLAVAAMLLGGTIEMSAVDNFFENGKASMWSYSKEYPSISEDKLVAYGIDPLLADAKETAKLIRAHHCAVIWGTSSGSGSREFILYYNQASDKDDIETVFTDYSSKLECVDFIAEDDWGDTDINRYVKYPVDSSIAFGDYEEIDGTYKIKSNPDDFNTTARLMEGTIADELMKEIQLNQFIISGYTASVKKAITDSLIDNLSTSDEDVIRDMALRPRGWGMFGGALLYTSQSQGSSSHMANSFDDVFVVESGATNKSFISAGVLSGVTETEARTLGEIFHDYNTEQYFPIGPTGSADFDLDVPSDMDEESSMQYFMYIVESLFLGPMDHIKAASGMPLDKSLSFGLQQCYDGGYESCFSGSKHPIVALSDFGNEMITNMITLMVTTEISKAAIKMADLATGGESGSAEGDTDSTGKKKKKSRLQDISDGIKSLIKGVKNVVGGVVMVIVKVILGILEVATVMLDFLKPLFATLLMVGIVFAYIIPMMAYIFGFMIMILHLVAIFVTAVIIPFYVLTKFITLEKEYKNGFKSFYQDFMGTYLTPMFFAISATVSWSLIVVVMYAINMTFSLINHGLTSSSEAGFSGISSLIFNIFMYVIYFIAIFVLFRFVLGLMKSLNDTMKERLNLKKGDDDNYINSLGFEQYVKATTMKQIAQMPSEMVAAISKHADKDGYKNMKDLRQAVEDAENVVERLGLNDENAEERGAEDAAKLEKMKNDEESNNSSNGGNESNRNNENATSENGGGGGDSSTHPQDNVTSEDDQVFVDPDDESGEPTALPDGVKDESEAPKPGDKPQLDSQGKTTVTMTMGDSTGKGDGASPGEANKGDKP